MGTLDSSRSTTRARMIAYGAVLSAAYVTYGVISSLTIGPFLHGVDVHFVRALVLVVGAASVKRFGIGTIIGFVSALLLAMSPIYSPDFLLLIPATFAAGVAYDLTLWSGNYAMNAFNLRRVFLATTFSSLTESIIVTGGLLAISWSFAEPAQLLAAIGFAPSLTLIVVLLLGRNVLISVIGAETGGYVLGHLGRKTPLK